jgi:5-methyltetrahydrofolate--homocysteine methyltransferase
VLILSGLLERIENSFAEVISVEQVKSYVEMALADRVSPIDIMQRMRDGLTKAGKKYEQGEFFLSDLIMSGILAGEVSSMLKPHLLTWKGQSSGKIVIGTVKGDIHDLGKNLVSMMLRCAGFEVVDVGVDVPSDKFVDAVKKENPRIAAMSCLLTSTMDEMKNTMDRLEAKAIRSRAKVLVGGRPITSDFAKEIGADGYAADAIEAMNVARKLTMSQEANA